MTAPADDARAGLTSPAAFGPPRAGEAAPQPAMDEAGGRKAAGGRELAPHEVLVRHALEVSRLTVTRMAEELGIPRATLEAYRLGTRRMPPAARLRLAAYLAKHSEMLRILSQALGTLD